MEASLWDDQLHGLHQQLTEKQVYGLHQQPAEEQAQVQDPSPGKMAWTVSRLEDLKLISRQDAIPGWGAYV